MFTRIFCRNTLIHRRPRTFEVAYPTSKRRAAELDCGFHCGLVFNLQSAIRNPKSSPWSLRKRDRALREQSVDSGYRPRIFGASAQLRSRKRLSRSEANLPMPEAPERYRSGPYERETRGQSRRPEAGSQPDRAKDESFTSPSPARRPLGLFERIRRARKAVEQNAAPGRAPLGNDRHRS